MSDQETNDQETTPPPVRRSGSPAGKSGNSRAKWAIRIVIFGALGGLLIVAGMQFLVKRDFEDSHAALRDAEEENSGLITLTDAEDAFVGDPESEDVKGNQFFKAKIYTWKGPFSSYRLKITYSPRFKTVSRWTAKQDEIETETE